MKLFKFAVLTSLLAIAVLAQDPAKYVTQKTKSLTTMAKVKTGPPGVVAVTTITFDEFGNQKSVTNNVTIADVQANRDATAALLAQYDTLLADLNAAK